MIDPEVARLRRLRREALRVRDIARAFESPPKTELETTVDRCACAAWRVARIVSGRLRSHPYADYHKDASLASQLRNRLTAGVAALTHRERGSRRRVLRVALQELARQLDDTIALAWSSDFSEALGRARSEIAQLGVALAREGGVAERIDHPVGVVDRMDPPWPYLAF